MTGLLGGGIYSGWELQEETIAEDDGTRKIYHTAVNRGEEKYVLLDWSPYRTMSNLEFRRMVELGLPDRDAVGSRAPLHHDDLVQLYNERTYDAPGGWTRRWAYVPVLLSDGSWVRWQYYWARSRNRWELSTHRVRTRWETWESWEPLHPVVQQLLEEPITSLPMRPEDGKSN
jgi:hypothetical protein